MNFQRIESFVSQGMNSNAMKAIKGGVEQKSEITGGGTLCSTLSATGCVAYSSDIYYYHANGGGHTSFNCTGDVAVPC